MKKVAELLNRYMNKTQLKFTDYEFQTLAIHLAIAIERIEQAISYHVVIQEESQRTHLF